MTSAKAGPYRVSYTPWCREILDSFADPFLERITWVASRQVGKTTTLENMILYAIHQEPGPAQYVLHSEDEAKRQLERLRDAIQVSPEIRRLLSAAKKDNKDNLIRTARMQLEMSWATSSRTLKGRSNRYTFNDEAESWQPLRNGEGHPIDVLRPSMRTFWNKKEINATTPLQPEDRIWQEYLSSDQRQFHVPCPHCSTYQVLEWANVKFPDDIRDPERINAEQLAWYFCPHCGAEIEHEQKAGIAARGVWVPRGCSVSNDGTLIGDPPVTKHRGYHCNCLISPMTHYAEVAAYWLHMHKHERQGFYNLYLGLPYSESREEVTEKHLEELEDDYEVGQVPDDVHVLFMGADLQREGTDHCYWTVEGYGEGGRKWHIESGAFFADTEFTDLEKLERFVLDNRWKSKSGEIFEVRMCAVDSGDGVRTHEVYDLGAKYPHRFRAVKGQQSIAGGAKSNTSEVEKLDGKRRFPGAVRLTSVNTSMMKNELATRMRRGREKGEWSIPKNTPAEYRLSLLSEHLVKEKTRNGVKWVWVEKPGSRGQNHYLDATIYCDAIADSMLVRALPKKAPQESRRQAREQAAEGRPARPSRQEGGRPERGGRRGGWHQSGSGGSWFRRGE